MSQGNANCESVDVIREEDRHDAVSANARGKAATEDTQMDLGPLPNWTLAEYRRAYAGMMNVSRFDSMTFEGKNLVIYDRSPFERDNALGA